MQHMMQHMMQQMMQHMMQHMIAYKTKKKQNQKKIGCKELENDSTYLNPRPLILNTVYLSTIAARDELTSLQLSNIAHMRWLRLVGSLKL